MEYLSSKILIIFTFSDVVNVCSLLKFLYSNNILI